ncbi:MAG: hypothetical protein EOM63_06340, partial [Clostridia bacterium]|nr:hypothetical protein [Clostridia bacterium]
ELDSESIELRKDFIDIRISAKEGFNVQMFNNKFIILDTSLDQDLLDEGCAREFVSRIQQLRKSNGYEVMDRIDITYSSDAAMDRAIEIYTDFIKTETLADTITITAGVGENSAELRARMTEGLSFMGIQIDAEKNNCRGVLRDISAEGATVRTFVIPTNEELVIAMDTAAIVKGK